MNGMTQVRVEEEGLDPMSNRRVIRMRLCEMTRRYALASDDVANLHRELLEQGRSENEEFGIKVEVES